MRTFCLTVCLGVALSMTTTLFAMDMGSTRRDAADSETKYCTPLDEHPTLLDMLKVNNRYRKSHGLRSHRINRLLCRAAQNQAEYMARGGEFSHYANGGYQGRARRFGYRGFVRENIAWGQHGVKSVFTTWINSSGHYASIMSNTRDAGFGLAYSKNGSPFWVAVYGSSAEDSSMN